MNFLAAKAKLIEKGIRIPDPINMEATEKVSDWLRLIFSSKVQTIYKIEY